MKVGTCILVIGLLTSLIESTPAATVGVDYAPGQVILRFSTSHMPISIDVVEQPPSVGVVELDSVFTSYGGVKLIRLVRDAEASTTGADRSFLLIYESSADPIDVASELSTLPYFESVSPNGYLRWEPSGTIRMVPSSSTTRFPDQWYFDNEDVDDKSDIDMPEAWAIETGDPNLAIGIFDTGTMVDTCGNDVAWRLHSDFNHLFVAGEDRGSQGVLNRFDLDGADNDADSLIDNVIGTNVSLGCVSCGDSYADAFWYGVPQNWSLPTNQTCGQPTSWEPISWLPHGILVGSLAAGKHDGLKARMPGGALDHKDIVGVAHHSKVYNVRTACLVGSAQAAVALRQAASVCRVINFSITGNAGQYTNDFWDAVLDVTNPLLYDCLLIAAVGNATCGQEGGAVDYPAAHPNVLGVGGISRSGPNGPMRVCYSKYKSNQRLVDFMAPTEVSPDSSRGIRVDSEGTCTEQGCANGNYPCSPSEITTFSGSGTSFAAPQVSGVAALVRSRFPSLKNYQVTYRLKKSCEYYWASSDSFQYGYGKVNAYRALTEWGSISTTTTWSTTTTRDGKYYVSGDLTIESGATLTINPGVVVKVAPDHERGGPDVTRVKITVKNGGTLNIAGSLASPVIFESFADTPPGNNDWLGITFEAGSSGSISRAFFRNAELALTSYVPLTLSNVTIENGGAGIDSNANLTVSSSTLQNLTSTAIVARSGNLTLNNVAIRDCDGSAITNSGAIGVVSIANCIINNVDAYGISFPNSATSVTIGNTTVDTTTTGILLGPQSSSTLIHDCAIRACDIGISLYGITGIDILDTVLDDNSTTGIYATAGSFITVATDTISGSVVGIFFDSGTGGTIHENSLITDNSVGVKFDNNATGTVRQTRITANNNGVASLNGSTPDLGVAASGSGCFASGSNLGLNSIYANTTYNVVNAVAGITLSAEGNWWNADPPKASKFFGSVDRDPYICADPNPVSPWDGPGPDEKPTPMVPTRFALGPSRPNPFNPTTTIAFDVPPPGGDVEISVFDVRGVKVRTLVDRHHEAGTHSVEWTGRNRSDDPVASGVYFVRMTAPSFTQTRKLILLK